MLLQAKPLLNDKQRVHEVLDPALIGAYPPKGLIKIAALVSSCLQLDPDRRPDMAVVHNVLSTVYEMPVLTPKAREQVLEEMNHTQSSGCIDYLWCV